METETQFDAFCDYTSINGIRFLHSRQPKWFRIISGITLLVILSSFLMHASAFIYRWTGSMSSAYIHTFIINTVNYPEISLSPPVVVTKCKTFDDEDCKNLVKYNRENNTTDITLGDIEDTLFVTSVQRSLWITFNRTNPNDDVVLSIRLTKGTNSTLIKLYSEYRIIISPLEIRDTQFYRVIYDVLLVPQTTISDYSVMISLGFGIYTTSSSSGYKFINFAIDVGSTLSLYFGMTALTVFELFVFFLYGRSSDIVRLKPAPPFVIVYNIPTHIQIRRRDAARMLIADRVRQQKLATILPPII